MLNKVNTVLRPLLAMWKATLGLYTLVMGCIALTIIHFQWQAPATNFIVWLEIAVLWFITILVGWTLVRTIQFTTFTKSIMERGQQHIQDIENLRQARVQDLNEIRDILFLIQSMSEEEKKFNKERIENVWRERINGIDNN